MRYERLSDELVKRVPELRHPYKRELRHWDEEQPGPHTIFGNVLVPIIFTLLDSGKGKGTLKRVFDFLEELSLDPDPDVRDVVGQAVGEEFWDHPDLFAQAKRFMGPETIRIISAAWDSRFRPR